MNLEQLAESTEKLAHEIPPLVSEIWNGHPKREKNSLPAAVAVISGVWEGKGMHSTNLVNWSAITRTNSSLHGAGSQKSRCTLSMGAPAWYICISALA